MRILSILFLGLVCIACERGDSYANTQRSMAVEALQGEVKTLRHRLHGLEVELRIAQDKVVSNDKASFDIKKSLEEGSSAHQELVQGTMRALEQRVATLEKQHSEIVADVRSIKGYSNEVAASLKQYKSRIGSMEKDVVALQKQIDSQVDNLKNAVDSLVDVVQQGGPASKTYVVQSGDTLDRIARRHDTTVEKLKKHNALSSDFIISGQELKIP